MKQHAFTFKANGLAAQLVSPVDIIGDGQKKNGAKALWDTGATGTCISKEVVTELGLQPVSQRQVLTPSGHAVVNVYLVDIILPNNVVFKDIAVCDSEIGDQGIDVLVGMDVILNGTFTVSNYGGKTAFSFAVPSDKMIDYAAELKIKDITSKGHMKKKK